MEGQQKMKDKVLHRLLKTLPMLIVLAVLAVAAVWINRSGEERECDRFRPDGLCAGKGDGRPVG